MFRVVPVLVILTLVMTPALFAQDENRSTERRRSQTERAEQQGQQFAPFFSIRGIEFSKEQNTKVTALREKYVPQLLTQQREMNEVYTPEQREKRRLAIRTARDAGKNNQQVRAAVDEAIKLSQAQQQQLAELQEARTKLQADIQKELRGLLTEGQVAQLRRQNNRNATPTRRIEPTHRDLKYGDHARHVMDVWLVESEGPAPVLVSIHGGGFRGGNKSVDAGLLQACHDAGISVVAITYRLSDVAIAPAQFYDAARAIQFIRHHAEPWNIDADRIASTGGSAGAGLSLWLGFHQDLAKPDHPDPVLRQSSRLTCMAVYNGQTSYDPRVIRTLIPENDTYKHAALAQLYDVDLDQLDNLPEDKYRLFEKVSALPHLTKDDVPALLMYGSEMETEITNHGIGIHHPRFGTLLKKQMDELDIECRVETGVRRGTDEFTKLTIGFVKKHFGME